MSGIPGGDRRLPRLRGGVRRLRRRRLRLALAALFAAYGLYIAATEGTSKALIGRAIPTGRRASALGLYYTATGLATFAASTVGGLLWSAWGPWATFAYGALAALVAAGLMLAGRGRVRGALAPEEPAVAG